MDQVPRGAVIRAQGDGAEAQDLTLEGLSKFIVLSEGFQGVTWVKSGQSIRYCDTLLELLGYDAMCINLVNGAKGFILVAEY